MKTSISYLPLRKQEELSAIVEETRKEIHNCEMIILYGSYANNNYIIYDEREEYNVLTSFMSDYDILVLTAQEPTEITERKLDKIDSRFFNMHRTPIQFLPLSIQEMNKCLDNGRFFHVQIKEEGVVLYDSGNYQLTEGRPLDYSIIIEQAKRYATERLKKCDSFLRNANYAFQDEDYPLAAFLLHQACEFCFLAIILTYTLSNRKVHDLTKLLRVACQYAPQLQKLFPKDSKNERFIFNSLRRAYKEGRYNDDFNPSREELIEQQEKVNKLRQLTEIICNTRIEEYNNRIQRSELNIDYYSEKEDSLMVAENKFKNDKDHYNSTEEDPIEGGNKENKKDKNKN